MDGPRCDSTWARGPSAAQEQVDQVDHDAGETRDHGHQSDPPLDDLTLVRIRRTTLASFAAGNGLVVGHCYHLILCPKRCADTRPLRTGDSLDTDEVTATQRMYRTLVHM